MHGCLHSGYGTTVKFSCITDPTVITNIKTHINAINFQHLENEQKTLPELS